MKNKKIISMVLMTHILLNHDIVLADMSKNIAAALSNIEYPISYSIQMAENIYEQNYGDYLSQDIVVLSSDNPFIETLTIKTNYMIKFKFKKSIEDYQLSMDYVYIPPVLLGTEIVMKPIHNKGDAKVNAWQCFTNADMNITQFAGETETPEFSLSFITSHTQGRYLSGCAYIAKKPLN